MTVFNKTNKIIGLGGTPVLPLAFATVPDSFKGNPILRRMADEGRIVINPSGSAARTAPEIPPTDAPPVPEAAAPEEVPPEEVPPAPEVPAPETQEAEATGEAAPKANDTPLADAPKKRAAKA